MSPLGLPHHDGSGLYVSDPDPELGDTVALFLRVPADAAVDAVSLRSAPDGEETFSEAVVDRADAHEVWWRADLEIRNPRNAYRFLLQADAGIRWVHAGGVTDHDTPDVTDWQLNAYDPPPTWATDAVCYQVFPDRFARTEAHKPWPAWADPADWDDEVVRGGQAAMNQLYGGDLYGVCDRLDHIAELGATMIWLNPIFESASNHRYNASSFDRVDPVLGGEQALRALLDAAHARGIRVVGDLTPNHTGDTHDWFRAAQADPHSPEAGFYFFSHHPDDYDAWLGVPTLPELNHADPELQRRLWNGTDSVVARWLNFGLDGWRIDVAHTTGRHGAIELNDVVARGIRRTLQAAKPDGYLVAEHFFDPGSVLAGDGWHGVMYYAGFTAQAWAWLQAPGSLTDPHTGREISLFGRPYPVPRWTGNQTAASIDAFRATIPWRSLLANYNLLDSHDTPRFRTVAGDRGRQRAGVGLQMTFPGIPVVSAGSEVGLQGWDHEDARKPMPWSRDRWDQRTLADHRELIALRRAHMALRRGGFRWAHVGDDVLVYLREDASQRLLVQVARAPHEPVRLPAPALGARSAEAVLDGPALEASGDTITLPGDGPSVQVWSL